MAATSVRNTMPEVANDQGAAQGQEISPEVLQAQAALQAQSASQAQAVNDQGAPQEANPAPVVNANEGQAPVATEGQSSQGQLSGGLAGISQIKADLNKFAAENKTLATVLEQLEQKTGLPREQVTLGLAGGFAGLVSLYLLFGAGAAFVCNVLVGVAYPATASLRASHTQDKSQNNQLLAYWSIFGGLLLLDSLLSEVPAYFLLKAAALLTLGLPQIRGAEIVFTRALEPALSKLDSLLNKSA